MRAVAERLVPGVSAAAQGHLVRVPDFAAIDNGPRLAAGRVRGHHRIPVIRIHPPVTDDGPMEQTFTLYLIRINGHLGPTALSAFPAMVSQRQGEQTVLTGLLPDRSALYGVLAEIEALGLDLVELRQLVPPRRSPEPGDSR